MSTVEDESVCLPGCRYCNTGLPEAVQGKGRKSCTDNQYSWETVPKSWKRTAVNLGVELSFLYFNYMLVNEM